MLYREKKHLEEAFATPRSRREYQIGGGFEGTNTDETKVYLRYAAGEFLPKGFVPSAEWDVESRLRWLEGLVDSDGCAYRSHNSVLVQVTAKDRKFLYETLLMLNTLGISAHLSPMKDCWRLGISANNVSRLQQLGFGPKRLDLTGNNPQREAARFTKVTEVIEHPEMADVVYCFTEENRHMGCFNGILTGQCGEQPLPPYGACLLGSINLPKFIVAGTVDYTELQRVVALAVRMMDNVVDVSLFPLPEQEKEAKDKRRLGLGVTGLADALIMMGVVYGSDQAVRLTGAILQFISNVAYDTSADLAIEKGEFPLYTHDWLEAPIPMSLPEATRAKIKKTGIRNSHLTSIAPTGTISLYAGNVSSGIEPVFAFEYTRKVTQKDGTKVEELVQDYARALDPTGTGPQWVSAQTLPPEAHLHMQAEAQKWIDSAISKTINLPEDIAFEDFKQVYLDAYAGGCKGCTTYRPNDVTGSVLSVTPTPPAKVAPMLADRPQEVSGKTYKLKWPASEHAMYITINDLDGSPHEIFINSQNVDHFAWSVALTRMVSAVFRRGGDVSFVHKELKAVFDPQGGAWLGGKYVPSMLAAIGGVIEQHMGVKSTTGQSTGKACPECKEFSVMIKEGCATCTNCGSSKCG
jgi:ribonucleoside-diphosphate reductase alpha chain